MRRGIVYLSIRIKAIYQNVLIIGKLMSHSMESWKRVTEPLSDNQFGFIHERSTMEAIFYLDD